MKLSVMFKVFAAGCALVGTMADASAQAPELKAESNTLRVLPSGGMLRPYGSGSQVLNEMRGRLADPQQRAKLREDQRRSIADSHYGVADALQLDSATFDRLVDLLADQQMEQSDYFHAMFAGKVPGNPTQRVLNEAERATLQIEALREVLGQEKLERYQALRISLGQRGQIRELDQRLGASDQLNTAQREQLVVLWHDHVVASMERQHMLNSNRSLLHDMLLRPMPSQEDLQRQSQLRTIAFNEQLWREMPESSRQLRERAAKFLTEPQLAMLAQMHAEQQTSLQQRTEAMRIEAGLSPTIPEQAQVAETPPAKVERDVKLSLKVAVNSGNPKYLTTVVSGGKSVSMKIADDLFLEATPIVFEDDAYNLRVEYFETGVTGKRRIGSMGQSGKVEQVSENGSSRNAGGGGATVLTGSKGYAVELSALVEAT